MPWEVKEHEKTNVQTKTGTSRFYRCALGAGYNRKLKLLPGFDNVLTKLSFFFTDMEVIRKNQAVVFKNSESCTAFEYPTRGKDINGAIIELTGRYPDAGGVVNERCAELIYVVSGSGSISFGKEKKEVSQGDVLLMPAREEYFWDGVMTLFIASTPAWYPEQCKHV